MRKKSTPVIKMKARKKYTKFTLTGEAVERKVMEIKKNSESHSSGEEQKPVDALFGHLA
jgi:hypothetical protein